MAEVKDTEKQEELKDNFTEFGQKCMDGINSNTESLVVLGVGATIGAATAVFLPLLTTIFMAGLGAHVASSVHQKGWKGCLRDFVVE